jgi:hypothetical protein
VPQVDICGADRRQSAGGLFVIDLPEFGGAEKIGKLGVPARTLVSFEGH